MTGRTAHTHPWRTTPLLRTPLGAPGMRRAQRSPRVFDATIVQARLYSRGYHPAPAELAERRSAITRRDGVVFMHNAAGFAAEYRRHAGRWDLAAVAAGTGGTVAFYVGGSDEDPYEHRQIEATRQRVPQAETPAGASPRPSSTNSPTSPSSPGSCSAAKTRTTGCSKSRSSTTPNAAPASSPTPASGTRPPKRPGCPRQRWQPPHRGQARLAPPPRPPALAVSPGGYRRRIPSKES